MPQSYYTFLHKAAMLENAKRMASEGVDAQKIGRKVIRIYIQGRS
jgi:hypothetical protein